MTDFSQVPPAAQARMAALLVQRELAAKRAAANPSAAMSPFQRAMQPQGMQQVDEMGANNGFGASPANPADMQDAIMRAIGRKQVPGMGPADFIREQGSNPNLMNFQTPENMRSGGSM